MHGRLFPPPRRHLTSFHGVYAPHAALRPVVTQPLESPPTPSDAGLAPCQPTQLTFAAIEPPGCNETRDLPFTLTGRAPAQLEFRAAGSRPSPR